MRNLNKVMLIGNIAKEPMMGRFPEKNVTIATFILATNRFWKDSKGEEHKDSEFHRCVAWNKFAEFCEKYLKLGMLIYVEGTLKTTRMKDKDDNLIPRTEIQTNEILLLTPKNQPASAGEVVTGKQAIIDEDIPEDVGNP